MKTPIRIEAAAYREITHVYLSQNVLVLSFSDDTFATLVADFDDREDIGYFSSPKEPFIELKADVLAAGGVGTKEEIQAYQKLLETPEKQKRRAMYEQLKAEFEDESQVS